ncbi:MAG: flagellar export chaperone FliS [Kineosporiaceae bacterium]
MSYGLAQARYASDTAATVSPSRLLVMLYDRLVADLGSAHEAMLRADWATSGQRIANASEILLELRATLDVAAWPDGDSLARLYLWMVSELMQARLAQSAQRVADCRDLVVPLRDAWRQAGERLAGAAQAGVPAGVPADVPAGAA